MILIKLWYWNMQRHPHTYLQTSLTVVCSNFVILCPKMKKELGTAKKTLITVYHWISYIFCSQTGTFFFSNNYYYCSMKLKIPQTSKNFKITSWSRFSSPFPILVAKLLKMKAEKPYSGKIYPSLYTRIGTFCLYMNSLFFFSYT